MEKKEYRIEVQESGASPERWGRSALMGPAAPLTYKEALQRLVNSNLGHVTGLKYRVVEITLPTLPTEKVLAEIQF